jgi:TatD DNase family protein
VHNNLFDICFNFTNSVFRSDEENVLQRAQKAGVTQYLITGSDLKDSHAAIELCERFGTGFYATAGVHPHLAKQWNMQTVEDLRELIAHPSVVAVGEAGLDYYRNYSSREQQLHAFELQCGLAAETGKPLFLHERDASKDFYPVLKDYRDHVDNIVVHCFTGDADSLHRYLDLDLHIGITGWICDERRGVHLQSLVRDIPANRLMIETDAPYLLPRSLPQPPRNRRNEPCFLTHIADTIATCREQTRDDLVQQTTLNANRFFNVSEQEDLRKTSAQRP